MILQRSGLFKEGLSTWGAEQELITMPVRKPSRVDLIVFINCGKDGLFIKFMVVIIQK
jgi:hypothetical protein